MAIEEYSLHLKIPRNRGIPSLSEKVALLLNLSLIPFAGRAYNCPRSKQKMRIPR